MQVTLEPPTHLTRLRKVAPVACGCALAGAAVLVALRDPADGGYPGCPLYAATGLWCPGCGLTRATHHLLQWELGAALATNLFAPLVLAALVAAWWGWLRAAWGRPPARRWALTGNVSIAAIGLLVVYGVLRNIPAAPFRALAP